MQSMNYNNENVVTFYEVKFTSKAGFSRVKRLTSLDAVQSFMTEIGLDAQAYSYEVAESNFEVINRNK